ncbi:MAG: hypothetical protein OXG07_06780 [Anaerolineaceae bacterium]|nr:hypothetical protein [Anaerolineaceae bacterium]
MWRAFIAGAVSPGRRVEIGEAATFQPVREAVDAVYLQPERTSALAARSGAKTELTGIIQATGKSISRDCDVAKGPWRTRGRRAALRFTFLHTLYPSPVALFARISAASITQDVAPARRAAINCCPVACEAERLVSRRSTLAEQG